MKRGRTTRGDQLTGGSGDVSPQWFVVGSVTQGGANAFVEASTPIPIQRLYQAKGKSTVIEILKVEFALPDLDTNFPAGGGVAIAAVQLSTSSQTAISFTSPHNIAFAKRSWRGAFTAAGTYATVEDNPRIINVTDASGHGVLIGTDTLFLDFVTASFAGAATVSARFLYRWKEVTLEEYIGIVQSQQ